MAIHHAAPGEPIDIRPLGSRLATSLTQALFKTDRLEVIRMIIRAGHEVPPHTMPGEIMIQCMEGSVDLVVDGKSTVIGPGYMVCLAGGETYSLKATEDTSLLVSMLLHVA